MANEFLDALSPGAEKRLKSYSSQLDGLIEKIGKVNNTNVGGRTPSGTDSAIKALQDDVKKTDEAVKKLQKTYSDVAAASTQSTNTQEANAKKILLALEQETKNRQALDAQRQKSVQANAVALAKEEGAILKQLAAEDRAAAKKIQVSKQVATQKEKEWQQFQKDFAKYEAALEKEGNAYNRISAEISKLTPAYNNLAAKQALGEKLTKDEVNQLHKLTGELSAYQGMLQKVDAQIGKHQRNVGNYASANRNLTASIGQISRELPNFGQSFQVGILSLTNNIGAIIDSIEQVKMQNKALAAEGQATKSALSQTLTALLSWQTALFVAIGVFSAYSKEIGDWVSSLWNATDALNATAEAQKRVNDAQERFGSTTAKYLQNAIKERDESGRLRSTIQDLNKSQDERENAADRFIKKFPGYLSQFTKEQVVLYESGKATQAYKDAIEELEGAQSRRADAAVKAEQAEKTLADASNLIQEIRLREQLNEEFNKTGVNIDALKKKIADRAETFNGMDEYVANFGKVELDALGRFSDAGIKRLQTIYDGLRAEFERERKLVNDAYVATSKLDFQKEPKDRTRKQREFDPEAAFNDARMAFIKRFDIAQQALSDNEKRRQEDEISRLEKLAKDETRSFDDRIQSYGEFLKKKQDYLLDSQAREIFALQQTASIEREEAEKQERAALKKAGAFDKTAAIRNAKIIADIRTFFRENEVEREQEYREKELAITEKYSKQYLDIAEETAKAEVLIKKKQRDIIQSTDKVYRDEQIKLLQKTASNEKNQIDVRQSAFLASISIRQSELQIERQRALAAANTAEEIDNVRAKYDVLKRELDELAKDDPFSKFAAQSKAALKSLAESMTSDFLGGAGLSSFQQFFDGTFDKIIEGFDKMENKQDAFREKAIYTALAISEAFQEMYNFLAQASQHNFDLERDNLEKKYTIDRQFAGENQAAIAELDKEAEARRKEIARREAKANKELAIFNIAMNAAQGIVAAFKDGNVIKGAIFAALIAGIAAVQISAISSQNVPSYWKGTENHPGGLMRVNDRGLGKELVITPDGKKTIYGGKDVIVDAPKGTKVKTAAQTALMFDNGLNNILNERGISMNGGQSVTNNIAMDVDRLGDRIEWAISRIPQIQMTPNHDAAASFVRIVANGNMSHNSRKYQIPIKYRR